MTRGPALKRAAAVALAAAAVWYLGHSLATNWAGLRAFHWQVNPLLLALSVAAQVAVLAWGVFVWSTVMRGFRGAPVDFRALLHIWAVSSLARYIPGGAVWQIAAASQLAESRGISRGRMVTSLVLHSGFAALSAVVVGVLVLPFRALRGGWLPAWSPWLVCLVVFAMHPRVLDAGLGLLHRVTRRELLAWEASWAQGIGILALECVSWLLYGGAYWLFLRSLAPFPPSAALQVCGVFSLSFVAGFVSPSGGGMGVREGMMTRLLEPYFPPAVAVLVSVVARLWTTLAEVLTALLAMALVGPRLVPAPAAGGAPADAQGPAAGDDGRGADPAQRA